LQAEPDRRKNKPSKACKHRAGIRRLAKLAQKRRRGGKFKSERNSFDYTAGKGRHQTTLSKRGVTSMKRAKTCQNLRFKKPTKITHVIGGQPQCGKKLNRKSGQQAIQSAKDRLVQGRSLNKKKSTSGREVSGLGERTGCCC